MPIDLGLLHRQGSKSTMVMAALVKVALQRHHTVLVATGDQAGTIARLAVEFPGMLFEIVGTYGVKVSKKNQIRK